MVDLHAHILPGLDDGPADISAAEELCRAAAEAGTREIVAAPKVDLRFETDSSEIRRKADALQQRLGDTIYIHRGADLRLRWNTVQQTLAEPFHYTINGHQYLLIDIGEDLVSRGVSKLIERFRDRGVVPILTQPERKGGLARSPARIAEWVRHGCLVQLTAGSLTGVYGEKAQLAAFEMMDSGVVHFVASDARGLGTRGPSLRPAYDFVAYRWGEARASRLFIDNPWATLWGEQIQAPAAKRKRRSLLSRLNPFPSQKKSRRRRRSR